MMNEPIQLTSNGNTIIPRHLLHFDHVGNTDSMKILCHEFSILSTITW